MGKPEMNRRPIKGPYEFTWHAMIGYVAKGWDTSTVVDYANDDLAPGLGARMLEHARAVWETTKNAESDPLDPHLLNAIQIERGTNQNPDPDDGLGDTFGFYDSNNRFTPGTAARTLDSMAPFAMHQATDTLWRYQADRGVYEPVANFGAIVAAVLWDYHKASLVPAISQCVMKLASRRTLDDVSSPLVAVANGVIDPLTGELREHSPDNLLTYAWPTPFDPAATCPKIMAYLETHLPEQADAFLDHACFVLERRAPQDRIVTLFGPTRSGKSTIARLLIALVGDRASSAVSLAQLAESRWAAAQLDGKALNVGGDLDPRDISSTALLKRITGGDPLEAEKKNQPMYAFVNHALLMFTMNEIPAIPSAGNAEWARFVPFEAPVSFEGAENPEIETELLEELPGLLAELVRRYGEIKSGKRARALPPDRVRSSFRSSADRVTRFAEERLRALSPEDSVRANGAPSHSVWTAFKYWCEAEGFASMNRSKFFERLESAGFPVIRSNGSKIGARLLSASEYESEGLDKADRVPDTDWSRIVAMVEEI